jgi:hypothetical protein
MEGVSTRELRASLLPTSTRLFVAVIAAEGREIF